MMAYNEKITALLLRECQRLFAEHRKQNDHCNKEKFGTFPSQALVYLHDKPEKGSRLRAWCIREGDGHPEEVPVASEAGTEQNGMYYSEGFFAFSISHDQSTAWIDMVLGPRYGRGYEYSIKSSYGYPTLSDQQCIWVS